MSCSGNVGWVRRSGPVEGVPRTSTAKLVGDVASDLKAGRLSGDDIPLEVFRDPGSGALVSANTRSLSALSEAGMRPTNITHVSRHRVCWSGWPRSR